jgi:hypothetical protein
MRKLPLLLAALLVANAAAQSSTPAATPPAKARPNTPAKAKGVLPDPELLDGSKYEPEKRPLYGMISEIEMGEEEGGQQDRVSPNSGPQGQPSPDGQQQQGGGQQQQQQQAQQEQPQEQQAGGGSSSQQVAQGNQGQAQGMQAQSIQGTGGAQSGPQSGARDMQIGDATLQIQTVPNSPETVGAQQASSSQQYEKKVPAGQQTNNRNQGVEKGKVIPKGL